MELQWHQINQAFLKKVLAWALMGVLGGWFLPAVPALAAEPPAKSPRPAPPPAAEEKKEEAPTTCGPLLSDTCIPLEAHKVSMSATFAYSFYPGLFDRNWKYVSAGGNFGTYYMPVRITVGVAKNWESYVIAPFIINTASSVNVPAPGGQTSATYTGIGDISWFNKYLLLPETDTRPAVSGVFGIGFPTGHASHLNPRFLGADAIGTGSFAFTTGVNLYKWLKPCPVLRQSLDHQSGKYLSGQWQQCPFPQLCNRQRGGGTSHQ